MAETLNVGVPDGLSLDRGSPGRSAAAEHERRRALDERRQRERFGRLAPLVTVLTGERQSTRAWSTGADGERRVAVALERALGDRGIVLHDRRAPRSPGNIDHLAIAPSGVWVVDAKEHRGRVVRRDVGGWFRPDVRLYVGGRDRSKSVEGVHRQQEAVKRVVMHELDEAAPPVHASICLVGAEWPWLARPFVLDGIWIAWPRRLGAMLLEPTLIERARIEVAARVLARRFPMR